MTENRRTRAARILKTLDRAEIFVANAALTVILLTISWNVVSRYILHSAVAWAGDVTSIAFAWFVFIGMAAVHNRRGHIGIDVLTAMVPDAWRLRLEKITELFVAGFCLYAAYLCGLQTIISQTTAATTVLRIPLSVLFISLAVGFALMGLRSLCFMAGIGPDVEEGI